MTHPLFLSNMSSTCCFNYLRKRSDPPRRPVATASTPAASMEREKGANTPPSESPAVDILSKTEVFQLRHLLRQLQSDWNSAVQNVAGSAGRHMDRSAVASYLAGLLLEPMQAFSSASAPPTFGLPLKSTSNTGPLISHNHLVDSGPTGGGRTTAAECYTLNGRRYCVESSMMELIGKS